MDGPVLVHVFVYLFEELLGHPGAQALFLGLEGGAVLLPRGVQPCRRRVAQAVALIGGVEGAIEEEEAMG